MYKQTLVRICTMSAMALALQAMVFAETVGVFYDAAVEQIKFAAEDAKAALEYRNFTVEMKPLTSLDATYVNKKVVIALVSKNEVTKVLTAQGGSIPEGLGEQAYGLRTTTTGADTPT